MGKLLFQILLIFASIFWLSGWTEPNWSENAPIPIGGRENIYQMSDSEWAESVRQGRLHALHYPIETTGIILPLRALNALFETDDSNPIRWFLKQLFRDFNAINSFDDLEAWIGLNEYPEEESVEIPFLNHQRPSHRMGFTILKAHGTQGFTISCAQCHSANLFGTRVLGLTNRFSRANEYFVKGKQTLKFVTENRFRWFTQASPEEIDLFVRAKENMNYVGVKSPIQLGLDTSLAQVSLSLARREQDNYASKNPYWTQHPRMEKLETFVADSKPAVWWNLKYKTRWLSDGSVISGNPIFTNFLWNEIGRGSDLMELEGWLEANADKVRELTAAVFSTQAPRYFDFFEATEEHLISAKRGYQVYQKTCAKCHGVYLKGWMLPNGEQLPVLQQLETTLVDYRQPTPVMNVGTDPQRYLGMSSLEPLNDLVISQKAGVRIQVQNGYVPPPLVGIWARWPYFHNNSIPNLCELLKPANKRVRGFYMGEAQDKEKDFDSQCNGYPVGKNVPQAWKMRREYYFFTRRPGSSNIGHDKGIFVIDGKNQLDEGMRQDLIRFLQTL
ncbi:MAG: cytochrome c [Bdellovibrionales bacterium]|nr:cytochrome c [Bdellovibrionales bacterium]